MDKSFDKNLLSRNSILGMDKVSTNWVCIELIEI